MTDLSFDKDLIDHIRSRYPILFIVSFEEQRVLRALAGVASQLQKGLFLWSTSDGLIDPQGREIRDSKGEALVSPLRALRHMIASQERGLFLVKDLHLFLEDPMPQYLTDPIQVRRVLRDIAIHFRESFKTLIILSPTQRIPTELEKDIAIFDFPLPNPVEIKGLLESTLTEVRRLYGDRVKVDLDDEAKDRIVKAVSGLTWSEIENVFSRAIVNDLRFDRNDIPFILSEKKQIIRKTGLLEYFEVQESFANVGGLEVLKDWLAKRGQAFSLKAREYGLPEPKGILLLGVQGCGKSLISKAISSLWRLPLLRLDVGAIFGKYVGESEENLRKAIRMAEALSPTILWLDEIEKAFAGVGGGSEDGGVSSRIFGSFITWLQEKTVPVFVIATSNNIANLPPELLRKGRFDEIFFVDLPSHGERVEILAIHLIKRRREPAGYDLEQLAQLSEGYSGAELEQAVIEAMFNAFHAGREFNTEDLAAALRETVPLSVTMREQIDRLRDWASTRAKRASLAAPPATPAGPAGPGGGNPGRPAGGPPRLPPTGGGLGLFSDLG